MKTRSRTSAVLAVVTALLLSACAAAADPSGDGEIAIDDVRTPVPAGPNGAVYMTLTNRSDTADRLIGASTDVAETVQLHETRMEDGSMQMQQLDGIDVPADGQAVLEPGGYHVMLIGVDQELAEGDTVDLTLSFERADDRQVIAEVIALGGQAEPAMDHDTSSEMDHGDMHSER